MKKLLGKIRSRKGETFIEILIAVLVISLSLMLVATMYSSAFNLNISAKEKDEAFYDALKSVEQMDGTPIDGSVTITDKDVDYTTGNETGSDKSAKIDVDAYEGEGVTSYKQKEEKTEDKGE